MAINKGNVETLLADLCEMKQCDASASTEAIVQYLNNKNIDVENIYGVGSDGACYSWHAASSVAYCNELHSILSGLYNYFHTSPNHYSVLFKDFDRADI